MKHFADEGLMAPNVLRVGVDVAPNSPLLRICRGPLNEREFARKSPDWNSDICWITARTRAAFAIFQAEFDRLGIAAHVEPFLDLDQAVRMYSGFLVERSLCRAADFHVDWIDTNNEAFTLLTPLTENSGGFGLLYQRSDGTTGEYDYRIGEALIIGDGFVHSTKPGRSAEPVILLSFTFGTDKMAHWERIARTAATQGELVRLPDGSFQRDGLALKRPWQPARWAKAAARFWRSGAT